MNVKFEKKKSALEKRKENRKKKEVEKEKDRKYEAVNSVLFEQGLKKNFDGRAYFPI